MNKKQKVGLGIGGAAVALATLYSVATYDNKTDVVRKALDIPKAGYSEAPWNRPLPIDPKERESALLIRGYALSARSQFKGQGTQGSDPGIDAVELENAQRGVETGIPAHWVKYDDGNCYDLVPTHPDTRVIPCNSPAPEPAPTATPVMSPTPVTTPTPVAVAARITVQPASVTLKRDQTQQFQAVVFDAKDQPISGAVVEWVSSNKAAVTIDAQGIAKCVTGARGAVYIYARLKTQQRTITKSATVYINR